MKEIYPSEGCLNCIEYTDYSDPGEPRRTRGPGSARVNKVKQALIGIEVDPQRVASVINEKELGEYHFQWGEPDFGTCINVPNFLKAVEIVLNENISA
ncbi:hypothetical protein HZB06_02700 [Candidatus Wolfebacteria bacterium]|nr:hypothetical protein [Candidatus Wolfebacteria bacterium]